MKRLMLYTLLRHIVCCGIGYAIGLFLLVAALTCGVLRSAGSTMTMQVTLGSAMRIVVTETVILAGLLLSSTHPCGCAMSAVTLLGKSYQAGLSLGWWRTQSLQNPLWLLPLGIQGALSEAAMLAACCMTAYAALRVRCLSKREYLRSIIIIWAAQMGCVMLRCLVCTKAL